MLDSRLDVAANKQMPYPEMLADLLGVRCRRAGRGT